jgi:hypothetical protein
MGVSITETGVSITEISNMYSSSKNFLYFEKQQLPLVAENLAAASAWTPIRHVA